MKSYLPWLLAVLLFAVGSSTLMAAEKSSSDNGKMSIEEVVENCEKQFSEQKYPDEDERNKLIDQCIDEHPVSQAPASAD